MKVAVLASGVGTNLQALIDRAHRRGMVEVVAVASDKPRAPALARAQAVGIPTKVFALEDFSDRSERDLAMSAWLREQGVELVVLAGYMQLLDEGFLSAFPSRVINVHPSLLPAFPGLNAVQQALDYGVKVFGATVFFVDGGVDSGPVILQRAIGLQAVDDPEALVDRLHEIEHELLPEAVALIARGAVSFDPVNPRRVVIAR